MAIRLSDFKRLFFRLRIERRRQIKSLVDPNSPAWGAGYERRVQGWRVEPAPYLDPQDLENYIDGWITADAEAEYCGYPPIKS
jgi:hypothetical protein